MAAIVANRAALSAGAKEAAVAEGFFANGMKLTSFQMTEVGRIMKDLATGQTAMLERSSFTLASSMGILGSAISFLLSPLGLVAIAIAAAVAAFVSIEMEQSKFNRALIETGNFAGTTVAGLEAMKEQIGSARGEYGAAATALTDLAASGKFSGDQLRLAA